MNESINLTHANPSNAATTGLSSSSKAALSGKKGGEITDVLENENTFSDTLSTINGDLNADSDGKTLPNIENANELAATADRSILASLIESELENSELDTTEINFLELQLAPQLDQQAGTTQVEGLRAESNDVQPLSIAALATGMTKQPSVTANNTLKTVTRNHSLTSSTQPLSSLSPKTDNQTPLIAPNVTDDAAVLPSKQNSILASSINLSQSTSDSADFSLQQKGLQGQLSSQIESSLTTQKTQQLNILTQIQGAISQRVDVSAVVPDINSLAVPVTQPINASPVNVQALPQMEISESFGRPSWSQAMGKQVVWMANQNIRSAEIRLNPAHLGLVEVRLDINDDQINVALSSRHAIVREAMEAAMPKLREMLDNDGLNLSDSDISHQSFAEQREQNAESNRADADKANSHFAQAEQESPVEDIVTQEIKTTSMVDYFI